MSASESLRNAFVHVIVAIFLMMTGGLSAENPVSELVFSIEAVHVDDNRPKRLTKEVNSFEVQKLLLRKPSLTTLPAFLRTLEVQVVSDELPEVVSAERKDESKNEKDNWLEHGFGGVQLLWPSAAIKESVPETYQDALHDYLKARLSGHTKSYVISSIQKKEISPAAADQSLLILLREHPEVPYSWIKKPGKGIGLGFLPGEVEYHVVDGAIVWVFSVSVQENVVLVERRDSQETDEKLAPKFAEAERETQTRLERRGIKRQIGYIHAYWAELRRVLKEKHGIIWRSPGELNPRTSYD